MTKGKKSRLVDSGCVCVCIELLARHKSISVVSCEGH